jgi:hypothetical protein
VMVFVDCTPKLLVTQLQLGREIAWSWYDTSTGATTGTDVRNFSNFCGR